MSRMNQIIENHEHLEKLAALLKHYSVNAEFITASLIEKFEGEQEEANEELVSDLKQLFATY